MNRSSDLAPLLDRLGIGFYRTTADGRVLETSRALAAALGHRGPAALAALAPEAFWADADEPRTLAVGVEPGGVYDRTVRLRHASGSIVEYRTSVCAFHRAGELVLEGVLHEVREQGRGDDRLADDVKRMRALLEHSWDGIAVVDATGTFLYVAPSVERILGYRPEELVGRSSADFVYDDREPRRRTFDELARSPGTHMVAELRYRRRDGSLCWLETMRTNLLHDPAVLGVVVNFRDVTERRRATEEERRARTEAEQANQAKDDFLATLSHELRSPVSAVLTWARLARSGRLDSATVARALETIERNAKLQVRLIDDLLDASRITAGRLALELGNVDLEAAVAAAVDAVQNAAETKGVRISWSSVADGAVVRGDDARLQQVFTNLLTNAVKFTEREGEAHTSIRSDPDGVEVAITDTGVGIDPARLASIFDRFGQTDTSLSRRHGGLGLGLAIVKHLVDAHDGSVTAQSAGLGHGATFRVRLPRQASGMALAIDDPKSARATGERSLRGVDVVVVDDERDARDFAVAVLERSGATVRAAGSVAEAFALLESRAPDVVVTDLAMPAESGFELVARLRDSGAALPVVALTALGGAADRARVSALSFFAHLVKPVDESTLVEAVASATRHGAPAMRSS